MSYVQKYLEEVTEIARRVDRGQVEKMIEVLTQLQRTGGRLFFLGVGGSAANCSHAVNDFRKLAGIETYSPVDNVAELTARTNDEGWDTVFAEWLKVSRLSSKDAVFVFSVGGGNREKNVSVNLVKALELAKETGTKILGVVGRDGGFTAKVADACVIIPTLSTDTITPHAEAWQGVIWHMLVSDPRVLKKQNKWESLSPKESATV
ncbi:MAG TPA: SIS domain-containing protein [Oligoflexia bacterium]|nr:SIS domain-containing protein [Oligoflexia bacterium]